VTREDELFVRLKYDYHSDNLTWDICKLYPLEVINTWLWRIFDNVSEVTDPLAIDTITKAKEYMNGKCSLMELDAVWVKSDIGAGDGPVYHLAAGNTADAFHRIVNVKNFDFNLYSSWLIEELCEYEKKNG